MAPLSFAFIISIGLWVKKGMIYHYTTLETLRHLLHPDDSLEIIEKSDQAEINLLFHATGAQFLNDAAENQLLPTVFRELGISTEALFTIDEVKGWPYVLSFSMDDDNLTMWRNYANDGHGVALGFNEETIKERLHDKDIDYIGRCEYVAYDELKRMVENDLLFKKYKQNPFGLNPLLSLYSQSLKYKHEAFAHEQEYRITFNRHVDEEFITRKNVIATYHILRIPFNALQTIVVGPCLDFEKTKFSVSRILCRYLYGLTDSWRLILTTMHKSKVPYVS